MQAPTDFHGLPGTLYDIILSFGCVAWKSKHTGQFLMVFYMSALVLMQQMDWHANTCVFYMPICPNMDWHANTCIFHMPICLTCNWSSALFYRDAGIMILLPVITILSMTATSSLKDHYGSTYF